MSRIGRAPINVPAGVEVSVDTANCVITVKGPKGTLTQNYHSRMNVTVEGNVVTVARPSDEKEDRALHGLTRTLINNMVVGVTQGYSKKLEVNGVG
jgi:large subunit ribosomal protein L6